MVEYIQPLVPLVVSTSAGPAGGGASVGQHSHGIIQITTSINDEAPEWNACQNPVHAHVTASQPASGMCLPHTLAWQITTQAVAGAALVVEPIHQPHRLGPCNCATSPIVHGGVWEPA
jgi:hypothetical protein